METDNERISWYEYFLGRESKREKEAFKKRNRRRETDANKQLLLKFWRIR